MEKSDLIFNPEDLDNLLKLIINEVPVSDLNKIINKSEIKVLLKSTIKIEDEYIKSFVNTLTEKCLCHSCLKETPILSLKCDHQICFSCSLDLIRSTENLKNSPIKLKCPKSCAKKSKIIYLKPLFSHPEFTQTPEYPKLYFLINNNIQASPNLLNTQNPRLTCSLCKVSFPLHELFYPCSEDPYCKPCLSVPLSRMTCSICLSPISIQTISNLLNN